MNIQAKRYPAFEDTTQMEFGKHKGELLQDVPPYYLKWLWDQELSKYSKGYTEINMDKFNQHKSFVQNKIKLANYIFNAQDAIAQELGEPLI